VRGGSRGKLADSFCLAACSWRAASVTLCRSCLPAQVFHTVPGSQKLFRGLSAQQRFRRCLVAAIAAPFSFLIIRLDAPFLVSTKPLSLLRRGRDFVCSISNLFSKTITCHCVT
jgi:hypothetical protein